MSTPTTDFTYPVPRVQPFGPPAEYTERHRSRPFEKVKIFGGDAWLLTRLADAKEMLENPDVSSNRFDPSWPQLRNYKGYAGHPGDKSLLLLDGEEHLRYRRLVSLEFTLKRVTALRPEIQQTVDRIIDEIERDGGPVDFVQRVSLPIASGTICRQLGVPYEDHEFFQEQAGRLVVRNPNPEDFKAALDALVAYIDELVHKKVTTGDESGLVGRLAVKVRSGEMSETRLASFALLLLMAGHETSANMLSLGILTFLQFPDKRQQVLDNPESMPRAVNELLRYLSIADEVTTRFARADTVIAGRQIRAGEGLCASQVTANFDSHAFVNPQELDFERAETDHLAFGAGPHTCLGQNLARAELEIAYATILRRLPTLRLAVPFEDVRYKSDFITFGVESLPVTW